MHIHHLLIDCTTPILYIELELNKEILTKVIQCKSYHIKISNSITILHGDSPETTKTKFNQYERKKWKEVISKLKHMLLFLNQDHVEEKTLKYQQNKARIAEINSAERLVPRAVGYIPLKKQHKKWQNRRTSAQSTETTASKDWRQSQLKVHSLMKIHFQQCKGTITWRGHPAVISDCLEMHPQWPEMFLLLNLLCPESPQYIYPAHPSDYALQAAWWATDDALPAFLGTPRDHPAERKRYPKVHYDKTPQQPFCHAPYIPVKRPRHLAKTKATELTWILQLVQYLPALDHVCASAWTLTFLPCSSTV